MVRGKQPVRSPHNMALGFRFHWTLHMHFHMYFDCDEINRRDIYYCRDFFLLAN